MNQQEIAERSIVDRYVLGQLSERELLEFEEYYFDHPEVLKEIALAEMMRDELRSTQQPQAAQSLASWSQRLLAHLTTPAWSLGATAAAVVLAGVLTVQTIQGPLVAGSHTRGSGSVMPVVADVSLVRMRGAQGAPPVVQIKAAGAVSITIDVAGADPGSLQATLRGPDYTIELPHLTPDPSLGIATVVVPTQILSPGSYMLELHDARGSNISYKFEVVP